MSVEILLENSTSQNWTSRLTLQFVNAYGVVLGSNTINWITSLEPSKRYTEEMSVYLDKFEDILGYSNLTRQTDFDMPKYVVVKYY